MRALFIDATRATRWVALAAMLAGGLFLVPDAQDSPDRAALVRAESGRGVDPGKETLWILAIGSDARPGQDPLRSRADAIQLVGMNTGTGAATTIGIPRDSYVSLPGYGRNRINAGLYFGGPQAMSSAVRGLIGIAPDYVLVSRFEGVEDTVDAIGGITVDNPRYFVDPNLKKEGFPKGRIKLSGYDAMAFSRIRKSLAGGDFDRSANQQRTLRGIGAAVRERAKQPGFIEGGVLSVLRFMETDLRPAELFRIAQAMAQTDPSKITSCVVPGGTGMAGAASVVFPDTATARRYGEDARKDAVIQRC